MGDFVTDIASDNEVLLIETENNIISIDETSDFLWKITKEDSDNFYQFKTETGNILVTSRPSLHSSPSIKKISSRTGLILWKFILQNSFDSKNSNFPILSKIIENTDTEVNLLNGDEFIVLDKQTGLVKKKYIIPVEISNQLIVKSAELLFFSRNKSFITFSLDENKSINEIDIRNKLTGIYLDKSNNLITDDTGNLFLVNNNRIKWKVKTGAQIVDIKFNKENIAVNSNDNHLYQFAKKSGKFLWKKRFQNRFLLSYSEKAGVFFIFVKSQGILFILDSENGEIINRLLLENNSYILSKIVIMGNNIIVSSDKSVIAFSPVQCERKASSN